jgi:hypothetical protein
MSDRDANNSYSQESVRKLSLRSSMQGKIPTLVRDKGIQDCRANSL